MGNSLEHIRHIMGQSMEALIHHFKLVTEGFRVPASSAYVAIEAPRGELGVHVVSDGGTRPYRVHFRDPSFNNLQAVPPMSEGGQVADVVAAVAHRPRHGWSGSLMALTDQTRAEMMDLAARYPQARSALLPMLHLVQSGEGYVTEGGIIMCAEVLGLTTAEVKAVATFYDVQDEPVGEYHVGVCINPGCSILGGDAIWETLSEDLGVGHDQVTGDGKISWSASSARLPAPTHRSRPRTGSSWTT